MPRPAEPDRRRSADGRPSPARFVPALLLAIGLVLAGLDLWGLVRAYTEESGMFANSTPERLSDTRVSTFPLVLLLLALPPLFIGELLRRGAWGGVDSGLLRGGRVRVVLKPLPLRAVLLWALVPIAFWVGLVAIPVAGVVTGTGFTEATDEFWMLVGVYGVVAAAVVGVFVASVVKRAAHARARAARRVAPSARRERWRIAIGQLRADSTLLALGFGLLGVIPLGFRHAASAGGEVDPVFVAVVASIGVLLSAGGIVLAASAWRTGEQIGYAESIA